VDRAIAEGSRRARAPADARGGQDRPRRPRAGAGAVRRAVPARALLLSPHVYLRGDPIHGGAARSQPNEAI